MPIQANVLDAPLETRTDETDMLPQSPRLLQVGEIAEWASPLFSGILQAVILSATQHTFTIIHPRTGEEAILPRHWLRTTA